MIYILIIMLLMVICGLYEYNSNKTQQELIACRNLIINYENQFQLLEEAAEYEKNAKARRKKATEPLVKQRKKK